MFVSIVYLVYAALQAIMLKMMSVYFAQLDATLVMQMIIAQHANQDFIQSGIFVKNVRVAA